VIKVHEVGTRYVMLFTHSIRYSPLTGLLAFLR